MVMMVKIKMPGFLVYIDSTSKGVSKHPASTKVPNTIIPAPLDSKLSSLVKYTHASKSSPWAASPSPRSYPSTLR